MRFINMSNSKKKLREIVRHEIKAVLQEERRNIVSGNFVGKTVEDAYYDSQDRKRLTLVFDDGSRARFKVNPHRGAGSAKLSVVFA